MGMNQPPMMPNQSPLMNQSQQQQPNLYQMAQMAQQQQAQQNQPQADPANGGQLPIPDPLQILPEVVLAYMNVAKGIAEGTDLDKPVQTKLMLEMSQAIQFLVPMLPSSHLMVNKAKAIGTSNPEEAQLKQAELQMKMQAHQQDLQMKAQSHQMDMAKAQHDLQVKQQEAALKQNQAAMEIQNKQVAAQQDMIHKEDTHKQDIVHSQEQHKADMQYAKQAAQSKPVSNSGSKPPSRN